MLPGCTSQSKHTHEKGFEMGKKKNKPSAGSEQTKETQGGFSKQAQTFYLQEYDALRNEILKRMEIRQQLFTFTLVIAGSFLSVGLATNLNYKLLFAYPLISLFIAGSWMQSDFRIYQLGQYIKNQVETKFLPTGGGWEHAHTSLPTFNLVGSIRGVVLSTQLLLVFIALLLIDFQPDTIDRILLGLDLLAFILTIFTLRLRGEQPEQTPTNMENQ